MIWKYMKWLVVVLVLAFIYGWLIVLVGDIKLSASVGLLMVHENVLSLFSYDHDSWFCDTINDSSSGGFLK